MNKLIKTILILIILLLPSYVNAETFAGTVSSSTAIVSHLFYTGTGDTGPTKMYRGKNNKNMYIYHYNAELYNISSGSKVYKALCIDPGASAGLTKEVTCQPLDSPAISHAIEDTGVAYLGTADENHMALELAVRGLSIKAGITSGSEGKADYAGMAIKNYFNGVRGTGVTLLYNASVATGKGETQINSISYSDTGALLTNADSIYNKALSYGIGGATSESGGTGTFIHKLKSHDSSAKTYTYTISSTASLVKDNFKYECENCNVESFTWNNKSGKVVIKATTEDCKFKFTLKYKSGTDDDTSGNKLYLCTPTTSTGTSRNTQRFIAYDDGGTSDDDDYKVVDTINHTEECDDDDDCECDEEKFKDDDEINMCCDESTLSYVIQPKISDLFCTYKKAGVVVNGYTANCVAESRYKVTDNYLSSDYCELYCTERMFVTIPKSSTGRNGKYFYITPVNDESKGPYFEGTKTCRLVTKYNKWVDDYEDATINAVNAFNKYQEKTAEKNMYENSYDSHLASASYKTDKTAKRQVTFKNDSVKYTCKGTEETTSISKTVDKDCTLKYKYYFTASDYNTVTYKKAMISWKDGTSKDGKSPINTYYGFAVKKDTDGQILASSGLTGYYDVSWNSETCGFTSTSSESCEETVSCDGSDMKVTGTCYYSSVSGDLPVDIKNDFEAKRTQSTDSESSAFNNNVTKIAKLEKYLNECLNYFDEGADGLGTKKDSHDESGNSPYKLYNFDPTVTFYYFQAYVKSSNQKVEALENPIDYKVTCDYTLTSVGETASGEATELGLEGWHFNDLNTNPKIADVNNFVLDTVSCLNNSGRSGCVNNDVIGAGYIDSETKHYSQRYTTDAYFKAICKSNDVNTGSYVIYPYGSFTTSATSSATYYTEHDTSYYIEYSTLNAAYETYWKFTGLGSTKAGKGVFDDKFTDNGLDTCGSHKNESGEPRLYCTLTISNSITKLQGCNEDGIISLASSAPYYWASSNGCCKKPGCGYDGEDELTYSFKIVDSEKLFPDNGDSDDGHYAYNWYDTTYGTAAMSDIQDTGSAGNTFAESHKTYEFILTTSDMEIIKQYNSDREKDHGGYSDFNLSCKCSEAGHESDTKCNGYFYDCRSNFINDFYNGSINSKNLSTSIGGSALSTARSSSYRHIVS